MMRALATFAAGYAVYHLVNTPQGQQMAKDMVKATLQAGGKAEDALCRAMIKAVETSSAQTTPTSDVQTKEELAQDNAHVKEHDHMSPSIETHAPMLVHDAHTPEVGHHA